VDTRLKKLRDGEFDAIVLAMAGLKRLRVSATHTYAFSIDELLPAAGQGALAIETLANAAIAPAIRSAMNDESTEIEVCAERAALRRLGAGCSAPVGLHARYLDERLEIFGSVGGWGERPGIRAELRASLTDIEGACALGERLAEELLARGARTLIDTHEKPLSGRRLLLPRTTPRPSEIAARLRALGAQVREVRDGESPLGSDESLDMLIVPSSGAVVVARPWLALWGTQRKRPLVAAMGPDSGRAIAEAGFPPDHLAATPEIGAFTACILAALTAL
ncbi:MAG TPA: hypothetical protein VMV73_05865, partial [Candidatus Dormibacteraeota bacterium]|nr:hypothetical protein [Candidatus Dormibacteraeota bacterium]